MNDAALPLRDLRLPEPVGWWPPAPGWWILAAIVVVGEALRLPTDTLRYGVETTRT